MGSTDLRNGRITEDGTTESDLSQLRSDPSQLSQQRFCRFPKIELHFKTFIPELPKHENSPPIPILKLILNFNRF